MTQITIDAYDYAKLAKLMDKLPREMQHQVFSRAMGRAKSRVERTYARLQSRRIKVAQKHILEGVRTWAAGGAITVQVRTAHIPLHRLGAKNVGISGMTMHSDDFGVRVQGRGIISGAFVSPVSARRAAGIVMKRIGTRSLPVKSLYGPNPAGEIVRNPIVYEDMLGEIAHDTIAVEVLRGVTFMLTKL